MPASTTKLSRTLCMCLALTATTSTLAQSAPEISADAARRDLRILKRAFVDLHPGLYRYATPAQIDAALMPNDNLPSEAWQFRVDGDTAILTLPTFVFWRSEFKPVEFLGRSFEALRASPQVRFLIIDQRRNEGGDDAIGRHLLSQLLKEPHMQPGYRKESAYERVPYVLARYLDTWDFGFFDRTGQVSKGPGRNWLVGEKPGRRCARRASGAALRRPAGGC